jgi:hypothetical protein
MNYAELLRRQQKERSQIIGFQNGQDASQVTLKSQALANSVKTPVAVETSFSKIGGTVANVTEATQQNSSPTAQTCASGYVGVSQGFQTTDTAASLIGNAQFCALSNSFNISATPYQVEIPCASNLPLANPYTSTVGATVCCQKDMGILFSNPAELIAVSGQAEALRQRFGQHVSDSNGLAVAVSLPPQPNGIPRNYKGLRAQRF